MKIHYVTSNSGKFAEASHILSQGKPIDIIHSSLALDELQGSLYEIIKHKAMQAYNHFQEPCVVDDGALSCDCLGGLPGPYIRPFLEALGDVGLWKLIEHYEHRTCTVSCAIAFVKDAGSEPKIFEGRIQGTVVAPRGGRKLSKHSWSAIVQPVGCETTFAEMTLEEASQFTARNKALCQLRDFLKQGSQ